MSRGPKATARAKEQSLWLLLTIPVLIGALIGACSASSEIVDATPTPTTAPSRTFSTDGLIDEPIVDEPLVDELIVDEPTVTTGAPDDIEDLRVEGLRTQDDTSAGHINSARPDGTDDSTADAERDTGDADSGPTQVTVPTGTVPTGTAPAETAPAETVPTGTVPTGTAPAETAPAETAPTGTVPAETAPAETVPTGTVPTGTVPAETVPTGTSPTVAPQVTFPQTTFPQASVRDPQAEAADLERRRSVIGLFERLRVESEHRGGYQREAVFDGWLYSDGRSTRDRVLAEERRADGTWLSAYDGVVVSTATVLDIDHLVPLAEAWESGGHAWSADTWTRFSNDLDDPRALIAVSASTNRSKGAADPQDWWPPLDEYHCRYASDWVAVKSRWDLAIDPAEQLSLSARLNSCSEAELDFATPTPAQVVIVGTPAIPDDGENSGTDDTADDTADDTTGDTADDIADDTAS